jgi:hypothetical protein
MAGQYDNPIPTRFLASIDYRKILISNGERFKPAFAERNKKQTMKDLRGISRNRFNNQLCPFKGLHEPKAGDG